MIDFYNTYESYIIHVVAAIFFGVTLQVNEMRQLNIFIRKTICIALPVISFLSFFHWWSNDHADASLELVLCFSVVCTFISFGGGIIVFFFFQWLIDYEEHDGMI